MSFTDAEKTDIRRFCGYPVFGNFPTQGFGYRFFQAYGTLEYRLNNLTASEEAVVRITYLPNLGTLETAIPTATGNLDTEQAGPWSHNPDELRDREALFDSWRRRLCTFLGVETGPGLGSPGVSLVV